MNFKGRIPMSQILDVLIPRSNSTSSLPSNELLRSCHESFQQEKVTDVSRELLQILVTPNESRQRRVGSIALLRPALLNFSANDSSAEVVQELQNIFSEFVSHVFTIEDLVSDSRLLGQICSLISLVISHVFSGGSDGWPTLTQWMSNCLQADLSAPESLSATSVLLRLIAASEDTEFMGTFVCENAEMIVARLRLLLSLSSVLQISSFESTCSCIISSERLDSHPTAKELYLGLQGDLLSVVWFFFNANDFSSTKTVLSQLCSLTDAFADSSSALWDGQYLSDIIDHANVLSDAVIEAVTKQTHLSHPWIEAVVVKKDLNAFFVLTYFNQLLEASLRQKSLSTNVAYSCGNAIAAHFYSLISVPPPLFPHACCAIQDGLNSRYEFESWALNCEKTVSDDQAAEGKSMFRGCDGHELELPFGSDMATLAQENLLNVATVIDLKSFEKQLLQDLRTLSAKSDLSPMELGQLQAVWTASSAIISSSFTSINAATGIDSETGIRGGILFGDIRQNDVSKFKTAIESEDEKSSANNSSEDNSSNWSSMVFIPSLAKHWDCCVRLSPADSSKIMINHLAAQVRWAALGCISEILERNKFFLEVQGLNVFTSLVLTGHSELIPRIKARALAALCLFFNNLEMANDKCDDPNGWAANLSSHVGSSLNEIYNLFLIQTLDSYSLPQHTPFSSLNITPSAENNRLMGAAACYIMELSLAVVSASVSFLDKEGKKLCPELMQVVQRVLQQAFEVPICGALAEGALDLGCRIIERLHSDFGNFDDDETQDSSTDDFREMSPVGPENCTYRKDAPESLLKFIVVAHQFINSPSSQSIKRESSFSERGIFSQSFTNTSLSVAITLLTTASGFEWPSEIVNSLLDLSLQLIISTSASVLTATEEPIDPDVPNDHKLVDMQSAGRMAKISIVNNPGQKLCFTIDTTALEDHNQALNLISTLVSECLISIDVSLLQKVLIQIARSVDSHLVMTREASSASISTIGDSVAEFLENSFESNIQSDSPDVCPSSILPLRGLVINLFIKSFYPLACQSIKYPPKQASASYHPAMLKICQSLVVLHDYGVDVPSLVEHELGPGNNAQFLLESIFEAIGKFVVKNLAAGLEETVQQSSVKEPSANSSYEDNSSSSHLEAEDDEDMDDDSYQGSEIDGDRSGMVEDMIDNVMQIITRLMKVFGPLTYNAFKTHLEISFTALLALPDTTVVIRSAAFCVFASVIEFTLPSPLPLDMKSAVDKLITVSIYFATPNPLDPQVEKCLIEAAQGEVDLENDESTLFKIAKKKLQLLSQNVPLKNTPWKNFIDDSTADMLRVQSALYCLGVCIAKLPQSALMNKGRIVEVLMLNFQHPLALSPARRPATDCAVTTLMELVMACPQDSVFVNSQLVSILDKFTPYKVDVDSARRGYDLVVDWIERTSSLKSSLSENDSSSDPIRSMVQILGSIPDDKFVSPTLRRSERYSSVVKMMSMC